MFPFSAPLELVKAEPCPTLTPASAQPRLPSSGRAAKPRLLWKLGRPSHSLWIAITCTLSTGNRSRKKVILQTALPVAALLPSHFACSLVSCLLGRCLSILPGLPAFPVLSSKPPHRRVAMAALLTCCWHPHLLSHWLAGPRTREKVTCTSESLHWLRPCSPCFHLEQRRTYSWLPPFARGRKGISPQGILMALQLLIQQGEIVSGIAPVAVFLWLAFLLKNDVFLKKKKKVLVEINIQGIPESCAIPSRS